MDDRWTTLDEALREDGTTPFFERGRGFEPEQVRESLPDLGAVQISSFAGRECAVRPWLVADVIPDKQVTLLSGDGGTGKSLAALQLAVAVAAGRDWLGMLPEQGGVVYLSAEDDIDEVHRRLVDILACSAAGFADLDQFHLLPLAGRDAVLALPAPRSEIVTPTKLWQAVAEKVRSVRPRLLVVDNLADAFAGNENSRPQARQFVGMLRSLAIECGHACLLLSHPSLTGLSTGTGTSGSTGWSNSVRSRLYLERAKSEDVEPDPDLRILRVMKTNYSAIGTEIRIRWDRGRFMLEGSSSPSAFTKVAKEEQADAGFLMILGQFIAQGRDVSHKPCSTYAPSLFAKAPIAAGVNRRGFEQAMERLFAAGKIKVEEFGRPSKRRTRIVPT